MGSPPPMRGKDTAGKVEILAPGITPAYAGKSPRLAPVNRIRKDHPRLCGEKSHHFGVTTDYLGSPPPMRGKAHKSSGTAFSIRITPAYAGKSPLAIFKKSLVKGSPPPMRGKVLRENGSVYEIRITPAYAGKSKSW